MKPSEVNVEVESDGAEISVRRIRMTLTHLPTQVYVTGDGYNKKLLRDSLWKDLEKKVAEHLALPTSAPVSTGRITPFTAAIMTRVYLPGVLYPWTGGPNPVPGMTVNVRLRNGSEINNIPSDHIRWSWLQCDGDVMEFMVL